MVTATVVLLLMEWVNADLEQNKSVESCIKRRECRLRRQRRNGLESVDLMGEVYRAAEARGREWRLSKRCDGCEDVGRS